MKLRSFYDVPARGVKALTRMVFRKAPSGLWSAARASYDYLTQVGDGTTSSTVMAPLLWITRTFPEAPPALWRVNALGEEERILDHDMLRLLQRPNPHYTGPILWMATLMDWNVDGNAYWLLLRDPQDVVREIWWMPTWMVTPKGDEDEFVSHYEYKPGNEAVRLRVQDVVHFRCGLDPDDQRKGYSPLKSVLREVFTDDEAARFTASLLRNMGVPGLLFSPDGGTASVDDVQATKAYLKEAFTGDRRGEPLVMRGPTNVSQFGFSPEQLVLRDLRKIPEERVTAVLGIPAIVAGLGAGLDRSTFTNMGEAKRSAVDSKLISDWRMFGEDLRWQLLSQWEDDPFMWRAGFDLSKVRALQEDQDQLMSRMAAGVAAGVVKRSEARRAVGMQVAEDGSDDVYLIPLNVAEVPADGSAPRTFGSGAPGNRHAASNGLPTLAIGSGNGHAALVLPIGYAAEAEEAGDGE